MSDAAVLDVLAADPEDQSDFSPANNEDVFELSPVSPSVMSEEGNRRRKRSLLFLFQGRRQKAPRKLKKSVTGSDLSNPSSGDQVSPPGSAEKEGRQRLKMPKLKAPWRKRSTSSAGMPGSPSSLPSGTPTETDGMVAKLWVSGEDDDEDTFVNPLANPGQGASLQLQGKQFVLKPNERPKVTELVEEDPEKRSRLQSDFEDKYFSDEDRLASPRKPDSPSPMVAVHEETVEVNRDDKTCGDAAVASEGNGPDISGSPHKPTTAVEVEQVHEEQPSSAVVLGEEIRLSEPVIVKEEAEASGERSDPQAEREEDVKQPEDAQNGEAAENVHETEEIKDPSGCQEQDRAQSVTQNDVGTNVSHEITALPVSNDSPQETSEEKSPQSDDNLSASAERSLPEDAPTQDPMESPASVANSAKSAAEDEDGSLTALDKEALRHRNRQEEAQRVLAAFKTKKAQEVPNREQSAKRSTPPVAKEPEKKERRSSFSSMKNMLSRRRKSSGAQDKRQSRAASMVVHEDEAPARVPAAALQAQPSLDEDIGEDGEKEESGEDEPDGAVARPDNARAQAQRARFMSPDRAYLRAIEEAAEERRQFAAQVAAALTKIPRKTSSVPEVLQGAGRLPGLEMWSVKVSHQCKEIVSSKNVDKVG